MADKLILGPAGKAMLKRYVCSGTPYNSLDIRNMDTGANYVNDVKLATSSSVQVGTSQYSTVFLAEASTGYSTGQTNTMGATSFWNIPSTSTEIENGYFADLSVFVTSGLNIQASSITGQPDSYIITFSNNGTETITINSLAHVYAYKGASGGYNYQVYVKYLIPDYYRCLSLVSLLVFENPVVLEPGATETRTITYDLSNV